jgi:hypothetical protein
MKEGNGCMNIPRRFIQISYCCCLIALTACATYTSNAKPSVIELRQRAENGDRVAQFQLGDAFDFGLGVTQDRTEAAKWYQMSADQGYPAAQNNLGSLYQYGLGVGTNYTKAVELYRKSAEQGFAMGQNSLGYMYDFGLGIAADKAEANSWYLRAADQGYPEAMMNLGITCVQEKGFDADLPQGFMWFDLARLFTQHSRDMKLKWRVRGYLDELKQHMTSAQIKEGERRAKVWSKNYIKVHKPKI